MARVLNAMGVTVFVLKFAWSSTGHPAPLQDVLRAVRLVRSRAAEFGVRADRVGIFGASAGGPSGGGGRHTVRRARRADRGAPRCGRRAARLHRPLYPVISLQPPFGHEGSRRNLLGPSPAGSLVEGLSLDRQVRPDSPPAFLVHTAEDASVPAENSILFYQALRRAKVPAELHLYEKGPHGFGLAKGLGSTSEWPKRLEEWLRAHGWLERRDSRVAWADVLRQPDAWYGSAEASAIADSAPVSAPHGGWPKDIDMAPPPSTWPRRRRRGPTRRSTITRRQRDSPLARAFHAAGDARDSDAVLRASTSCSPRSIPTAAGRSSSRCAQDYSRHITFNDDAMVHRADVLDAVAPGRTVRLRGRRAPRAPGGRRTAPGGDPAAQIRSEWQVTAWCAQHDDVSLAPPAHAPTNTVVQRQPNPSAWSDI